MQKRELYLTIALASLVALIILLILIGIFSQRKEEKNQQTLQQPTNNLSRTSHNQTDGTNEIKALSFDKQKELLALKAFEKHFLQQDFLSKKSICKFIKLLGMDIGEFSDLDLEDIRKNFQGAFFSDFLDISNKLQNSGSTSGTQIQVELGLKFIDRFQKTYTKTPKKADKYPELKISDIKHPDPECIFEKTAMFFSKKTQKDFCYGRYANSFAAAISIDFYYNFQLYIADTKSTHVVQDVIADAIRQNVVQK